MAVNVSRKERFLGRKKNEIGDRDRSAGENKLRRSTGALGLLFRH